METGNLQTGNVHHGHNIRRIRSDKGIKQEALADMVSLSQQSVSRYEAAKVIDDEMLERFAKALDVSADTIKTMEEATGVNFYMENNTFREGSSAGINNIYNPVREIIQMCNEKIELYERMMAQEKETISKLEQLLKAKK